VRAFRARRCSQHSTRCHSRRKNAVRRDSPRYSWGTASVSATFSLDVFKYGPKRRDCTQPGRTRLALIVNAGHSTTNDCFAGVLGDVRFWPVVARHRRISAHDRSGRCLGQEPHISHPGCLDAGGRGLRHRPRRSTLLDLPSAPVIVWTLATLGIVVYALSNRRTPAQSIASP